MIGQGYGGQGIVDTYISARYGDIDAISGSGHAGGQKNVTAIAEQGIGQITGTVWGKGNAIDGGSYSTDRRGIDAVLAEAGPGGGTAILNARFQVAGQLAMMFAASHADGISGVNVHAYGIGGIDVNIPGGEIGKGISASTFETFSDGIESIEVFSSALTSAGIDISTFRSADGFGRIHAYAFGGAGISGCAFEAVTDFGSILAEAPQKGPAIGSSLFTTTTGSIGSIETIARGRTALDDAMANANFCAARDIGPIKSTSFGGSGIVSSTFLADSDKDNIGQFASIVVKSNGRNLVSSSGIVGSTFTGTAIGAIDVTIATVEGGTGIAGSTFRAVTADYDSFGNFDNKGTIGNVTVSNASMTGTGNRIESSTFEAGSAGTIGNVSVTVDLGEAILGSTFDATKSDLDQNLFTSTIGTVSVKTSRSTDFTKNVAGIDMSTFKSNAGIVSILVDTVGTGLNGSTFNADADHGGLGDIPGPIGDIRVNVPGRNASGVVMSTFAGSSIGNVVVRLEANATTAMDAIRGSTFTALVSSIGDITVVNAGVGYAIADSTFLAVNAIGNISVTGDIINTQFIVTNSTIGNVYVKGKLDQSLSMQAEYFGNITFEMLAAAKVTLSLPKVITMGNLTVTATGSLLANLALTATPLVQAGNELVDGQLALSNSLTSVASLGSFQVGSLASTSGNVGLTIGTTSANSQIGAIVIGQAPTGKAQHTFRFGAYGGNPDAVVGTASGNAKTGHGALIGNVRFILNQGTKSTATQTKKPAPEACEGRRQKVAKRHGQMILRDHRNRFGFPMVNATRPGRDAGPVFRFHFIRAVSIAS